LFEEAGAIRVQAGTEVGNAAMRAVLERVGFRLEGVMRSFGTTGDGTPVDEAMYAMVRSDLIGPGGQGR
jgi:RimJ/RimL family protein N-acetyltransferase